MQDFRKRLEISLLCLRIGVVTVMLPWALDKILRPEHASRVFESFYKLDGLGASTFALIGVAQLVLVLAFASGLARTWTYGAILILHAISTFSSWSQYLEPYEGSNLLFFAAWPMLAACLALFLLRDHDRLLTFPTKQKPALETRA
jgi:putative oxidoreductase